jgi:hypothetical protein
VAVGPGTGEHVEERGLTGWTRTKPEQERGHLGERNLDLLDRWEERRTDRGCCVPYNIPVQATHQVPAITSDQLRVKPKGGSVYSSGKPRVVGST